jgi:hypothetical protein
VACVTWSSANSNWTTGSCTTTANSKGVTCECDSVGVNAISTLSTSLVATDTGGSSSGLAGKWIGVIAGVGGVALVAVIVGSVIGVKRRRRGGNAAPAATNAAAAAPADAAASSSGAPAALAGVSVDHQVPSTPSSSSYSSSSSSRSIVSSSSSEEEIMEQQIKDIVTELSTALPRDPRALEVLGDKLDME